MTIPVVHDGEATWGVKENCCFCFAKTNYWHRVSDVAVCKSCAKTHKVSDIPNKQDWCKAVALTLDERKPYVCPKPRGYKEPEVSEPTTKSVPPNLQQLRFRKALEAAIGNEGKDLDAAEILASLSHMVGQVIAVQDQRKMTQTMAMKLVSENIQQGNMEAIEALMNTKGGIQ